MKTSKKLSLAFVLLYCLAMLSGCCTLFPKLPNCPPIMAIGPTSLDFGTDKNSMIFNIENNGGKTLVWTASTEETWIRLSPVDGRANSSQTVQVKVIVDRSAVASGTHNGTVQVSSNDGVLSVVISMTKEENPKMAIIPTSLDFGTDINSMTFSIKNDGGGTLKWDASTVTPWITLSPLFGSATTGGTNQVKVIVDRSTVASGTHNGEVQVNSNDGVLNVVISMTKVAQDTLRINFSSLYVHHDKEAGDGHWKIRCKVNDEGAVSISGTAGWKESVYINQTFVTRPEWNRVDIFCRIEEEDRSKWQEVGEGTQVYTRREDGTWPPGTFGDKTFYFDEYEGEVTLKYSISPSTD